jgi:hypothetical protein
MNKKISLSIILIAIITLAFITWFFQNQVSSLKNQISELQSQLDNQQKAFLLTSLGISAEPRNTTYPHPHFTIEGIVINVGTKTAYNASLQIIAYYKSGALALNLTIPFGNLAKWETGHVNEIIATSEYVGNYTVTPTWIDAP